MKAAKHVNAIAASKIAPVSDKGTMPEADKAMQSNKGNGKA